MQPPVAVTKVNARIPKSTGWPVSSGYKVYKRKKSKKQLQALKELQGCPWHTASLLSVFH